MRLPKRAFTKVPLKLLPPGWTAIDAGLLMAYKWSSSYKISNFISFSGISDKVLSLLMDFTKTYVPGFNRYFWIIECPSTVTKPLSNNVQILS